MKEDKKKEILLITSIIIILISLNIFSWNSQEKEFKDEEGNAYYLSLDSYAHIYEIEKGMPQGAFQKTLKKVNEKTGKGGITVSFILIAIANISIIYLITKIATKSKTIAIITTTITATTLAFINNTQIGIIDKNPITLLIICSITYIGIKAIKTESGARRAILIVPILATIISSIYIWGDPIQIFASMKMVGSEYKIISEMQPIYHFIKSIPIAIGLAMQGITLGAFFGTLEWELNKKKRRREKMIMISYICLLITGICISRLYILTIPIFAYCSAKSIDWLSKGNWKKWKTTWTCIIIGMSIISLSTYSTIPVMSDAHIDAINYANSINKTCIIGMWDYGNIYRYYSDKFILYHSHPYEIRDVYDYFAYGNKKALKNIKGGCITIYSSLDNQQMKELEKIYGYKEGKYWIQEQIEEKGIIFENKRFKIGVVG